MGTIDLRVKRNISVRLLTSPSMLGVSQVMHQPGYLNNILSTQDGGGCVKLITAIIGHM